MSLSDVPDIVTSRKHSVSVICVRTVIGLVVMGWWEELLPCRYHGSLWSLVDAVVLAWYWHGVPVDKLASHRRRQSTSGDVGDDQILQAVQESLELGLLSDSRRFRTGAKL